MKIKNIMKFISISSLFVVIFFVSILFSCNKKDENFGYNILPDSDKIKLLFSDTTTVKASTYKMDSLISSSVSVMLLGNYADKLCGKTSASFALQFAPEKEFRFLTVDIPDSVVLNLPFRIDSLSNNYYGDISVSQKINVYRLTEKLSYVNNYYSHKNPSDLHSGELLGSVTYRPYYSIDTLRITLKSELAKTFIEQEDTVFSSPEKFFEIFEGVYIEAESSEEDKSIVKFDRNADMRIDVFYHKESTTVPVRAKFPANVEKCAAFNMFSHQYEGTDLYDNIGDDTKETELVYIQETGGLRTKIQFPNIKEWGKDEKIVIKRAELIVETAEDKISEESNFPAVNKLLLTGIADDGGYYLLPEYNNGSIYSGVNYDSETKKYRFDIAEYLTTVISGEIPNNGIYIFSSAGKINFNRSVIQVNKIKLAITYVKI